MLIHHILVKAALVSILCLSTSCGTSRGLSTTPTPSSSSALPEKETSLYEGNDMSKMNTIEGSIGIVNVRGKEAYFDQKRGKLLKPPGYFHNLAPFSEGLAGVSKGGKLGFINEQGEWVIHPRFLDSDHDTSHPHRTRFYNGIALIHGKKDRFINKKGEFITPAFDFATIFDQDVAVVMVNKKYGLINKQGKFIVSPQFTEYPQGSFDGGGMLVKVNGQEQCIDKHGLQIKINACKYILEPKESKITPSAFEIKDGGVYFQGKLLPKYKWDRVIKSQNIYGNNSNPDANNTYKGLYVYVVGNKWGLVHESGEVRTPPQFDLTASGDNDTSVENFYFGYSYFHNGLAQAKITGKYGFIDETGKFVIPAQFDEAMAFKFDAKITTVKLGNKWGAIDQQGNFVIQPKFESSFDFDRRFSSLALFQDKSKYGFIDRQGKIVTPAKIDEIQSQDFASARGVNNFYDSLPNEGLVKARIGKKWGYVNTQGQIQIPMRFDSAQDFKYGLASVELGSKTLYIDRQGRVLPF
jgi:predicted DNA-binding WGR domain protein